MGRSRFPKIDSRLSPRVVLIALICPYCRPTSYLVPVPSLVRPHGQRERSGGCPCGQHGFWRRGLVSDQAMRPEVIILQAPALWCSRIPFWFDCPDWQPGSCTLDQAVSLEGHQIASRLEQRRAWTRSAGRGARWRASGGPEACVKALGGGPDAEVGSSPRSGPPRAAAIEEAMPPPPPRHVLAPRVRHLPGVETDDEVALLAGVSPSMVTKARQALGIPARRFRTLASCFPSDVLDLARARAKAGLPTRGRPKGDNRLASLCPYHFGGWYQAVEAAELKPPGKSSGPATKSPKPRPLTDALLRGGKTAGELERLTGIQRLWIKRRQMLIGITRDERVKARPFGSTFSSAKRIHLDAPGKVAWGAWQDRGEAPGMRGAG